MIVQDRHERILECLRPRRRLSLSSLQRRVGVSRSTLRRDLLEMEHLGKVVRMRGHVAHADNLKGEPSYDLRRSRQIEQKRAIGRIAAGLVPQGASVFIDAGTTCAEAARHLLERPDLRLFTNSPRICRMAMTTGFPVVCIGGVLRTSSEALVGPIAHAWLDQLRLDVALMGASGLDDTGASTTDVTESETKRRVLSRAARVIVLADLGKWQRPSTVRFADWDGIDALVTERRPDHGLLQLLHRHRVTPSFPDGSFSNRRHD